MAQIVLRGTKKYVTGNPSEVITVQKGTVYIYVTRMNGQVPDRTFFFGEAKEGTQIPSFSVVNQEDGSYLQFLLEAKEKAIAELYEDTEHIGEVRARFLEENTPFEEGEKRFSQLIGEWYEENLSKEHEKIEHSFAQKEAALNGKINLMASVFMDEGKLHYEEKTDSLLYDTMSVYCNYMNIPIIPYAALNNATNGHMTIYDIARSSHFVLRKIKLEKKWYKKDAGAFVAFFKDSEYPVLLIPKGVSAYLMYDLGTGTNCVVEKEEAEQLAEDAFIAYQPLPDHKLTLKEVMKYGMKRIRNRDVAVFVLMALISTLIGLLLPIINEQLFDNLIPMGNIGPIMQVGVVLFAVMFSNIFFELVQSLANFRGVKSMEYAIVSATYDRLFRLPQQFLESFGTSELVNRINSVSTVFSQTVSAGTTAGIGFVLSLFYLHKMFTKSKPLAWRGVIMAVILGLIMYGFGRARVKYEKRMLETSTSSNNLLYQFVSGILKIKISGIENRSLYEYEKVNTETIKYTMQSTKVANIGQVFTSISTVIYTGVIFYTVIKKKQNLTLGEYTAFNSAYGMFTSATSQLVQYFVTRARLVPVLDRIRPIYEQEAEAKEAASLPGKLSGEIEVDHLDFSYNEDENRVLEDITFKIDPGSFVGIVGPSGCGKSTLLKCLLGFEKPTKGKVFYDNKDVETMDKCEMRKQMGVVLQDGAMVVGNIYTNVTLAAPGMEPAEVEDLLDEVGMHEDMQKMPMGIFTAVSEGGGTLSGGQMQRVLIARALANNPSILYFDEATSALDNITQQNVCERLEKRNMTRVMIAHRLSTVKNCDRILVMDQGRIVEDGNYEELMKNEGLFYELVKRQEV